MLKICSNARPSVPLCLLSSCCGSPSISPRNHFSSSRFALGFISRTNPSTSSVRERAVDFRRLQGHPLFISGQFFNRWLNNQMRTVPAHHWDTFCSLSEPGCDFFSPGGWKMWGVGPRWCSLMSFDGAYLHIQCCRWDVKCWWGFEGRLQHFLSISECRIWRRALGLYSQDPTGKDQRKSVYFWFYIY